jgi:site-specific recombinase XerD
MRIEHALDRFLVQLEADGRSIHTINQYRRHVTAFTAWARSNELRGDVDAITHEDAARFLSSKVARTTPTGAAKKATSANALRTSLKVFFGYLHRAGITERDAGRLIRRAITSPGPPKTLTAAEQERLLDALARGTGFEAERDRVLFTLMLRTGIRVGSAVALDVPDVNPDAGEITLRCKGDRIERVFLGDEIREALRDWIGERSDGPLFATRHGGWLTTRQVARRLGQWVERAGIKRAASPHALRHTFATALYRRTGDVLLVKEALRHRSVASTLVYARVDGERLRRAMA